MCVRDHEEPTSAFVIPLLSRASKKAPPFAPPFVHALLFTPGWCASSAPGAEPEAFGGVLRLSLLGAPVARRAPRLGPYRLLDRFWTVGRSSRGRRGRVSVPNAAAPRRAAGPTRGRRAHVLLFALSCKSITGSTDGGGQCTRSGARERQKSTTEASEPEAEHRPPRNEHKTRAREHMNHEA